MASIRKSTGSLTAQNTWVGPRILNKKFNVSISGTWAGTLTLQRAFDGGVVTWFDVFTYTTNMQDQFEEFEPGVNYRLGFKTGEYTSGTAVVRISQ